MPYVVCCAQVVESDSRVGEIHANSENFDTKAEASFKYLQVGDGNQYCIALNGAANDCVVLSHNVAGSRQHLVPRLPEPSSIPTGCANC